MDITVIKSPSGSIEMIMCFALIALFNTFSIQHLLSIYYVISHFNKKQTHTINYKPEKLSYLGFHSQQIRSCQTESRLAVQEMPVDPHETWISVVHTLATHWYHLEDLLKKTNKKLCLSPLNQFVCVYVFWGWSVHQASD